MHHKDLPHINAYGTYQYITYRLNDSLPKEIIQNMELDLNEITDDDELFRQKEERIDDYLNKKYGSCILEHPEIASIVLSSWSFNSGKEYDLIAWVIMPNHVHLLIKQYLNANINDIVKHWKSYTSRLILDLFKREENRLIIDNKKQTFLNELLNSRKVWQRNYWDRYIRNEEHLYDVIDYIHNNPVKAKLISSPELWAFSSYNQTNGKIKY